MSQSAKAGLDAANNNGHGLIGTANQIAVDHRGIVRPFSHDAAGGKGISIATPFGDGIVIDHGIHVPAGDDKGQTGLAKETDAGIILPVRLGDNAYRKPVGLQNPTDDGMTKGGMIHIGIPDDIYKIQLLYPTLPKLLRRNGQKIPCTHH